MLEWLFFFICLFKLIGGDVACLLQENVQCSSLSVVLEEQETPDECAAVVNGIGYEYFSFGKSDGNSNRTCLAESTTSSCSEGVFSDNDFDFYKVAATCTSQTDTTTCTEGSWSDWSLWDGCDRPYPQGWHARTRSRTRPNCADDVESKECVPTAEPTVVPTVVPTFFPSDSPVTPVDCEGTIEGPAYLDVCDVCVGGTTGKVENSTLDCEGVCDGSAFLDQCGACVGGTTGLFQNSTLDCNGVCGGTAYLNSCGVCVGGDTGKAHDEEKDCLGVCFGFASNGDPCGYCDVLIYDGGESRSKDCNGDCFGTAEYDDCGNCVLGATGRTWNDAQDACGVCNGDGSSCAGCDAIANSGVESDQCGVCGGDDSTCKFVSMVPSILRMTSTATFQIYLQNSGITTSSTETITCMLQDGNNCQVTILGDEHVSISVDFNVPANPIASASLFTLFMDSSTVDWTLLTIYNPPSITTVETSDIIIGAEFNITYSSTDLTLPNIDTGTGGIVCKATFSDGINDGEIIVEGDLDSSAGTIFCEFSARTSSFQVQIDLCFDGGSVSIQTNTYTAYADAPRIIVAQLGESLNDVTVIFDVDVNVADYDDRNCYTFFSSGTQIFGVNPTCNWLSYSRVHVTYDSLAVAFPNDNLLVPLTDTIKRRGELYGAYLTTSTVLAAPANPETPEVHINGPKVVSVLCTSDDFVIDAALSDGHGARAFFYSWSSNDIDLTSQASNTYLSIDIDGLTAGMLSIELELRNYMTLTNTAVHDITLSTDSNFTVSLEGPTQITPSEDLLLYANVNSCGNSVVSFLWSVDDPAILLTEADNSLLYVEPGVLEIGQTYTFTCVVSDDFGTETVSMEVTVEGSDIVGSILDGSRHVSQLDSFFSLDCLSNSLDPDDVPGDLRCDWMCSIGIGGCISQSTQSPLILGSGTIQIDPSELKKDIVHTFEAVVWKGDRSTTTSIEIVTKDEYVIPVEMHGPAIPQQASEVNEIIASFEYEGTDFTYNWYVNDSTTSTSYEYMGEGMCVDGQSNSISYVSFGNSNEDECEEMCTQTQQCTGYLFFSLFGENCYLYGFCDSSTLAYCDTVSCSQSCQSNEEIMGTKRAPPWLSCYKKITQFSYTDLSNLEVSISQDTSGTWHSVIPIPANTFQNGAKYYIKFEVSNSTYRGEGGWFIHTRNVPNSGTLIVADTTLQAVRWVHPYIPLTFQFGYVDSSNIFWGFTSSYHWIMHTGYLLDGTKTYKTLVSDRFGSESTATVSSTNSIDVTNEHDDIYDKLVYKPSLCHNWKMIIYGIHVMQSFIETIDSTSMREQYTTNMYSILSQFVNDNMNDQLRLHLIGGLASLSYQYLPDSSQIPYMSTINSLLDVLTSAEVYTIQQIMYRTNGIYSSSTGMTDTYKDSIRQIDDKALKLSFLTLRHEQVPLQIENDYLKLASFWSSLTENYSFAHSNGLEYTISFSNELVANYSSWNCGASNMDPICLNLKISVQHYVDDIFTTTADTYLQQLEAKMVSGEIVKVTLANPSTNEIMEIDDIDSILTVNFTINENANETDFTYNCAIWDSTTNTWTVDRSIVYPEYVNGYQVGCTFASYAEETSVIAVIARLTTFTPTFTPTMIPTINPTDCVQAGVSTWSNWTICVDYNNRTRTRSCNNPEPTCWWKNCTEHLVETECCEFYGTYDVWSDWTDCEYRGEGFFGDGNYTHRTRTCFNPNPSCASGNNCTNNGEPEEWVYCGGYPSYSPTMYPTDSPTALPQGNCAEGWSEFHDDSQTLGSCYYKGDQNGTRAEAQAYCLTFNATLIGIESMDENLLAWTLCEQEKNHRCWIGGTATGWEDVDGSIHAYTYESWDSTVTGTPEYAYLDPDSYAEWHSDPGTGIFYPICEYILETCKWPIYSSRIEWEEGTFGVTYNASCATGYTGNVQRYCGSEGWEEAVDNCKVVVSQGGVWSDDTATDGYGWTDQTVTDGWHGPFSEGTSTSSTFSVNSDVNEVPYVVIKFNYRLNADITCCFGVYSSETLLWSSTETLAGDYEAEIIVPRSQLDETENTFPLLFGTTSSGRRFLDTSGSVSFTNLSIQPMTDDEITETYCVNTNAYKESPYYPMFNQDQSGFSSSSSSGNLYFHLSIPRYLYDIEIAFENALNDYAAYNSSRTYPQNNTALSSEKTYWYSDHTADTTCGNETWTAEIPWSVLLDGSGGILSLDSYSTVEDGVIVEQDPGLYYAYGSILTVSVTEPIEQTYTEEDTNFEYTWSTTKSSKYVFPFVLKFQRQVYVNASVNVPSCPPSGSDCTLQYVSAIVEYAQVEREYSSDSDVGEVVLSIKTLTRYPYMFITGNDASELDSDSNYFAPTVVATPDSGLSVETTLAFVSETTSTCTFENGEFMNSNKICEQNWQLTLSPNSGSCYASGSYHITWYAKCFHDKDLCYFHRISDQIQNEAPITFDVQTQSMCPVLVDDIDLDGTLCCGGTAELPTTTCVDSGYTTFQNTNASFIMHAQSNAARIISTEILSIGIDTDLSALENLDENSRPRYDMTYNGQTIIWQQGDPIPGTVAWSDDYSSETLEIVKEVINSDSWGDPIYAGFVLNLDEFLFPASLQSFADHTVYAVYQVTYEGFSSRRFLASSQLELRSTKIHILPAAITRVEDYLYTSVNPNAEVDMDMIITASADTILYYNKDRQSFERELIYLLSYYAGTNTGEIDLNFLRLRKYEIDGRTYDVFDVDMVVRSIYDPSVTPTDIANKVKRLVYSRLLNKYTDNIFGKEDVLTLTLRPKMRINPKSSPVTTATPVVVEEQEDSCWSLLTNFSLLYFILFILLL